MAHLYAAPPAESSYARRNWQGSPEEYQHALDTSCTVYVGNLSFYTREEQIWELFSKVGQVKRIVMGLNKRELTPCGFCFVEYVFYRIAWSNSSSVCTGMQESQVLCFHIFIRSCLSPLVIFRVLFHTNYFSCTDIIRTRQRKTA